MSDLRDYCVSNATYQSSPAKMTYHFNSRITRFSRPSTFREKMRKDMLLLNLSRVQRAVVLELRNVLLRFSDPKTICLQCTDISATYLSSQLPRKTYHFKGNQRIQRYTEYTLHRQKIEMVNTPLLVQQFTHPVHSNSSYRLSYLLREFVDKTGKIRNRQQTKHKGKNKQSSTHGKRFSF